MSFVGALPVGIQGFPGLVMAGSGGTKLASVEMQVENFDRYGYPQWPRVVTGGPEVLGAPGLLAAIVTTDTLALAGGLLTLVVHLHIDGLELLTRTVRRYSAGSSANRR